jgi:drug/metabolite transporter (DMT)-like permease
MILRHDVGAMMWVGYALLSAFALSTVDALSKKRLGALRAPQEFYLVAWARLVWATPLLLPLFWLLPHPPLDGVFWRTIAAMVPLELLALVLYVKALQRSPLSLTLPFLSLTPVFLLGTSAVILGEMPTPLGVAGVVCIVLGAFLLHLRAWREGVLQPLRLIWREPGSRYMIATALIYSVTADLGKRAILHSSPLAFGLIYFAVLSVAFLPVVVLTVGWRGVAAIRRREFAPIGLWEALMIIAHVLAIVQTNVSYMIAVKRTSQLFGLAYGAWWFGERQMAQRWLGTLVMLAGVALTAAG